MDRQRLAVAIAGGCAFANLYTTQPLLPLLGETFAATPAQTSLTVTAGILSVALTAPIAGLLADGWGRKPVIVIAILALIIPTVLAGLAGNIGELAMWRFVQGICLPFIFTVTVAYIGEEWTTKDAAAVTGLYIAGTVTGGFLGRLVAGLVAEWAGWRAAFFALGALDLLTALLIIRWLPWETRFVRGGGLTVTLRAMGGHLRNKQLLAAFAVAFSILFVLVGVFTYVNFLLAAPPYDLSAAALGTVFVVYLAGTAVSPFAGRLAARIGHRRVAALGAVVAATGLLITLAPPLWGIIAGLAVTTAGIFITQSSAIGYAAAVGSAARSAAVGLYSCAYYLGGSLGAVAPAAAWRAGGWPGVVALCVAAEMAILALALLCWRDLNNARGY